MRKEIQFTEAILEKKKPSLFSVLFKTALGFYLVFLVIASYLMEKNMLMEMPSIVKLLTLLFLPLLLHSPMEWSSRIVTLEADEEKLIFYRTIYGKRGEEISEEFIMHIKDIQECFTEPDYGRVILRGTVDWRTKYMSAKSHIPEQKTLDELSFYTFLEEEIDLGEELEKLNIKVKAE